MNDLGSHSSTVVTLVTPKLFTGQTVSRFITHARYWTLLGFDLSTTDLGYIPCTTESLFVLIAYVRLYRYMCRFVRLIGLLFDRGNGEGGTSLYMYVPSK